MVDRERWRGARCAGEAGSPYSASPTPGKGHEHVTTKKKSNGAESWPASKVELWSIDRIKPYDKNPRTHSDSQVDLIAASMRTDGVTQPILVDDAGVIIAGHGRRLGAIKNGYQQYPVVIARGWSEEQKRAVRVKDNQITLLSGWDTELIKGEIASLKLSGYDLHLLGFGDAELVQFSTGVEPAAEPRASLAERFGVVPFSVLNAREGWWQARKDAWIKLGIQSELGRGDTSSTSARVGPDEAPTYRTIGGRKANATVGGSALPAADYKKSKSRGDGRGRAIPGGSREPLARAKNGEQSVFKAKPRYKPNAIPGGAMLPLERAKIKNAKA